MALVLNFTPQRKIWDGRTNISECIFEALEATETNQPSHRAGRIRSSRVPNIHVANKKLRNFAPTIRSTLNVLQPKWESIAPTVLKGVRTSRVGNYVLVELTAWSDINESESFWRAKKSNFQASVESGMKIVDEKTR